MGRWDCDKEPDWTVYVKSLDSNIVSVKYDYDYDYSKTTIEFKKEEHITWFLLRFYD